MNVRGFFCSFSTVRRSLARGVSDRSLVKTQPKRKSPPPITPFVIVPWLNLVMRTKREVVAILLLCAVPSLASGGIEYTVTDLGTLAGPVSVATCINNNGWIAGWGDDDPVYRYAHAWVWTGSSALQDLGCFGGTKTVSTAFTINDTGWVAGQSDTISGSNTLTHGFLWTGSGTSRTSER